MVIEVDSEDIVVGDVIILDAGRYVPCDIRLTDTVNLMVEESSLTGESVPVLKDTKEIQARQIGFGRSKEFSLCINTCYVVVEVKE